jgi:hypothetical protein
MPKYQNDSDKVFGYMNHTFKSSEVKSIDYFIDPAHYPHMLMLDPTTDLYNPVLSTHKFTGMTAGDTETIDINIEHTSALRFVAVSPNSLFEIYLESETTNPHSIIGGVVNEILLMFRRCTKVIIKCVEGTSTIVVEQLSTADYR